MTLLKLMIMALLTIVCTKLGINVSEHVDDIASMTGGILSGGVALWMAFKHWREVKQLQQASDTGNKPTPPLDGPKIAALVLLMLIPVSLAGCGVPPNATPSQQVAISVFNYGVTLTAMEVVTLAGQQLDKLHETHKIDNPTYNAGKDSLKIVTDNVAKTYSNVVTSKPWTQADTDNVKLAFSQVVLDYANAELKARGLPPIVVPPLPVPTTQPGTP